MNRLRPNISVFVILIIVTLCAALPAWTQGQDMSNVNDVLGGQRTILENDDIFTAQVSALPFGGSALAVSASLTSNSAFAEPAEPPFVQINNALALLC